METAPLSGKDVGIDRVPDEHVPEPVVVVIAVDHDEVMVDELAQRPREVGLVAAGDGRDELVVDAVTSDRKGAEDVLGQLAPFGDAEEDDLAQRRRNVAVDESTGEQL